MNFIVSLVWGYTFGAALYFLIAGRSPNWSDLLMNASVLTLAIFVGVWLGAVKP